MDFDWTVSKYNYHDRIRNLDHKAQGVVKSDKFFPVFLENGQERIFKPLSKTKPLSTPYFAYSEVLWSTIIHRYFDPNTPIYKLAICEGIEEDFPNKYHHGTIVDSLVKPNEKLVNLYEVFRDHPDPLVDIENYINYCEIFYNYEDIFQSSLMKENKDLASALAKQVLLSILKLDQNYHYENVLFGEANGKIQRVLPMIDHEFSTMFLYADDPGRNIARFHSALSSLTGKISIENVLLEALLRSQNDLTILSKNLDVVVSDYRETSIEFLENLKQFKKELEEKPIILEDHNYLTPFNSDNFRIGQARFKKNDQVLARSLENEILQYNPDIKEISGIIQNEVLLSTQVLEQELEKRLVKQR